VLGLDFNFCLLHLHFFLNLQDLQLVLTPKKQQKNQKGHRKIENLEMGLV